MTMITRQFTGQPRPLDQFSEVRIGATLVNADVTTMTFEWDGDGETVRWTVARPDAPSPDLQERAAARRAARPDAPYLDPDGFPSWQPSPTVRAMDAQHRRKLETLGAIQAAERIATAATQIALIAGGLAATTRERAGM